ncbi:hypothetical protein C4J91_1986 [Pseudomonas sp. R3-52-08]|nr:hypothetical protein C4J91_1986 [Pseudomonas sp. R3-52-08]
MTDAPLSGASPLPHLDRVFMTLAKPTRFWENRSLSRLQ